MVDPFTAWSRLAAAGLEMQSTWWRGIETLQASSTVIGARGALMRNGAPSRADLSEYARMIPEKVDAFGRSGGAVMRGAVDMQIAWIAQLQRVCLMTLSGRTPTIAEASILASRSTDYALGAFTATADLHRAALAPIHRAAAGNARRLGNAGRG
ncbi:hypothetical protein [Sphingomonas sp. G-3-2-10]|uniref:hypothetical protein n=1 Tax=Sphingomonas sp. G-3-2-10 TaxID=2728838 RepID=UPI00146B578F|nr:hypothetical protein [Sphingomonas sp. G-3-2-10]NML04171.1 hypothetical protein [Sphingomonas sp. G-3-2-10]